MRYSRDGKWTPVPFSERVQRAGWGLLFPPLFSGLCIAFGIGCYKLLFFVFPHLQGKPHPEFEPWGTIICSLLVLWNVLVQESAIINRDYADLDEMVMYRLKALESCHTTDW